MLRAFVVFTALAAVGALQAAEAAPSTIVRGVVLRGPVAPVCVEIRPCSAPVPSGTIVFTRGGREVARTTTNRLGRFSVRLAAGAYGVRILRQGPLARISPRAVRVPPAGSVWLRLDVDTGIRGPGPMRF